MQLRFDCLDDRVCPTTLPAGFVESLVSGGLMALTDAAWQMSGEVILMTLIGGLGTVLGPAIGATIIIAMQDYLKGLGDWVLVAQGVVFVVTVLLFRKGIVGEIADLASRAKR